MRRDVQRRPEGSKPAFDPEVFRSRFLLMRRPDKLDAAERGRLDALFETHPRLKAAWDALGELHQLYLADDREGALEALDRFADIYGTGHIPEFQRHRRHVPRMARPDPRLAPHRAAQQRPHRPNNSLERVRGCRRCR